MISYSSTRRPSPTRSGFEALVATRQEAHLTAASPVETTTLHHIDVGGTHVFLSVSSLWELEYTDMIWSYVVIICTRYIALSVHPTLKVCLCFRPSVSLTVSASAVPTRAAFIPQSKLLLALWSSGSCNMLQPFSVGFIAVAVCLGSSLVKAQKQLSQSFRTPLPSCGPHRPSNCQRRSINPSATAS